VQPQRLECNHITGNDHQYFKINTIMISPSKIISSTATVVALLMTFTVVGGCNSEISRFDNNDQPYLTERFSMAPGGALLVKTSGGSVKVEGGNDSEVEVQVYISSGRWSGDRLERELEENYDLSIEKSGDRLEAIAERRSRSWLGNGISISFVVKVPTEFECELRTSGGSISLKGVTGDQQLVKTSGGSLALSDIKGHAEANTSGGSINVDGFSGSLRAKTSGGSIKIDGANGDIDVGTSGGSIKMYAMRGSINARTSGGSITAEVIQLGEELVLKTSGGSVKAVVPAGKGLDLDLKGNRVNTQLVNFNGESEKDRVIGTVNGGGIPVQMATSGGSVTLEYN